MRLVDVYYLLVLIYRTLKVCVQYCSHLSICYVFSNLVVRWDRSSFVSVMYQASFICYQKQTMRVLHSVFECIKKNDLMSSSGTRAIHPASAASRCMQRLFFFCFFFVIRFISLILESFYRCIDTRRSGYLRLLWLVCDALAK